MGLYNEIHIEKDCPCCKRNSKMFFQFYTACSPAAAHLKVFSIGDTLPWFSPEEKEYSTVLDRVDSADIRFSSDGTLIEHTYGHCLSCKKALRSHVAIKDLKILSLTAIEPDPERSDTNRPS